MPDLKYRSLWWDGANLNVGQTTNGGLPKITGGYGLACNGTESSPATMWYGYGSFYQETVATRKVGSSGSSATSHGLAFDASRSSGTYFRTDGKVVPCALKIGAMMIKCI